MKLTETQFNEFDERGFLRLPSLHSSDAIQALIQRVRDIMAGRIQYEGMFFQLESNRETTTFQGPSSEYRKIKDLNTTLSFWISSNIRHSPRWQPAILGPRFPVCGQW
jgi:hypothetical protein